MATGLKVKNDDVGDVAIWGESRTRTIYPVLQQNVGVYGRSDFGPAVFGQSNEWIGVYGFSSLGPGVVADSGSDLGVDAYSQAGTGVRGHSHDSSLGGSPGVYGSSRKGPGIWGDTTAIINRAGDTGVGVGVLGQSIAAPGVHGTSTYDAGIRGDSNGYIGAVGTSTEAVGVWGHSDDSLPLGSPGVFGTSAKGPGVSGDTTYSGVGEGVLGQSIDAAGVHGSSRTGIGVKGVSGWGATPSGGVSVGVYGNSIQGIGVWGVGGLGGLFGGGLITLRGVKSAAVRSRDGSHRLLYCVESPESWFEDFGRARLVRGKAEVKLDATFAAVVRTDDYHIFLSPEGNCAGLYVSRRTRVGFQVREQGHGTSTVAFSYRIVARRKDVEAPRFAKLPKHLDPSHLRKTLKAFKPPKPPKPLKPLKLPKLAKALRVAPPPRVPRPKQRRPARGPGAR